MPPDVIPIQLAEAPALTGNAPPLLRELSARLARLLDTGEPSAIDLSALPLTPADLDWLRDQLGPGEVSVTLDADGVSTFEETGCAGVWWITHRNEADAVTLQLLEVAFVPELVRAQPADVAAGREWLESMIEGLEVR